MSSNIATAWSRTMAGIEINVESFVNELLIPLVERTPIAGRLHGTSEIEFTVGPGSTKFIAPGAKFRMVCARLAVVFGGASQDPPLLYGGHLATELKLGESLLRAKLEFRNLSSEAWFRVDRIA